MNHLTESLEELEITKEARHYVADELKSLYETIPPSARNEIVLRDLPKTITEYEEYEQRCDELFYMVLPNTVKEYEESCDFLIKTRFDCAAIMLIHIRGERMKRRYVVQHWKAIDDTRVRSLKRLFALYNEWCKVKYHEAMDHVDVEDLTENLDELVITKKVMAEELKGFYGIVTSKAPKELFMWDLPYTTEEYEKYEQKLSQEEKILYTNLPITLKEYEQYCDYVIECIFDLLPIYIVGEKLKKRDLPSAFFTETICAI
jgi:hypothetical protein